MINNLNEAIHHCLEKAEEKKKQGSICCDSLEDTIRAEKCLECAKEQEQLAEWLTELKQRREADRPKVECVKCVHFENASLYNSPCDDCHGKNFEPKEE